MNNKNEEDEQFYNKIAEILGCEHIYVKCPRKNRWNNRHSGNGRFPSYGIVKRFSSNNILIQFYNPAISGLYKSDEDAVNAIRMKLLNST